ncbi:DUF3173 domain-containing protein [Listeria monocytogenes]|nr:DUF3173 domain-containing protein [Listeria monocytogenes]
MKQTMIIKDDLINLGFSPYQSSDLIRRGKALMIQRGFTYYNSKRLGRVPISAVEEILGVSLEVKQHA